MTPGHEIAGEIAFDPAGERAEGERVACYFYESCGACRLCRMGLSTLCRKVVRLGIERDGGLAELVAMSESRGWCPGFEPRRLRHSFTRSVT